MKQTPLVEDIQNYAQDIVDTVREPLLIFDATLHVQSANRAFYQTFHVSPRETEGHLIYELGNGQWDIPDLPQYIVTDINKLRQVFINVLGNAVWPKGFNTRNFWIYSARGVSHESGEALS